MKIASIETIEITIPLKPGQSFDAAAWGSKNTVDSLLVKVTTENGIVGWGETFGFGVVPAAKAAIDNMIAPLCIGRDAEHFAPLMSELQKKLHIFGRGGPVMYGLSALDIALWDIAGKRLQEPVHELLGGKTRSQVPVYASLMRFTKPELVKKEVRRALDAGFCCLKLHEIELEAIRAAREEAGPTVPIMLDVNCAWNLADAFRHVEALEEIDLRWVEEPVWPPENFDGLAQLRRKASVPIAAGENVSTFLEFDRMLAAGAVDVIQPSPSKMGGLTELAKVATLASLHNSTLMVHAFYDGPGLLAALQATAVYGSHESMVEWRFFELEAQIFGQALKPLNGNLSLPRQAGLGFDPDEDVVRTYRVKKG